MRLTVLILYQNRLLDPSPFPTIRVGHVHGTRFIQAEDIIEEVRHWMACVHRIHAPSVVVEEQLIACAGAFLV